MKRITELDGVRGLGAVVVMIYHLRPQAFALAGIRVDLFLVLSGFLITTIVLDKAAEPGFLGTFFVRRWIRILPPYYLAILALLVINPVLPKPFPMAGLPYYLTFTQNLPRYWGAAPPAFNWYFLHTWSLALEQQFYLLWPIVVLLVGRGRVLPVALALVAASVVARALGVHWWLLVARCDGLALGSVLGVLLSDLAHHPERRAKLRHGLGVATAGAILLIVVSLGWSESWDYEPPMTLLLSLSIFGFNLFFFGAIGLIACATGDPALRVLRDRRLVYLGRISYGLYLYHPLVFIALYMLARGLGLGAPLWMEPVKLIAAVAVAALSWHFVEQPVMQWRSRFSYAGRPQTPAPHRLEARPARQITA